MKIVVLAGGTSTERDVSLISGTGIYKALKAKGHQVVLIDIYLGYDGEKADDIFSVDKDWSEGIKAVGLENPDIEEIKKLRKDGGKSFFGPNVLNICNQADVAFLGLHGANGEDGKVQATLELMGIPYTGTDYLSSAIAMDKALSKEIMVAHNIPTPIGYSMKVTDELRDMDYPMVIKVNNGGSSVGVYIVNNDEEAKKALNDAKNYSDVVVVEKFIKGREFTCGVIDGKALPIVEIIPLKGFYDYKNKYQAGSTKEQCPAELSEELTAKIQRAAEDVFKALRLKAYARIDVLMDEDNNIYCLEANTLPGMTPTSLLPQEAQAIGMDYGTLCEKLIEVSMK